MNQRTKQEQQKVNMLKTVRSAIRLKHSLAADIEINAKLPKVEEQINKSLQSGAKFELDIASILKDV